MVGKWYLFSVDVEVNIAARQTVTKLAEFGFHCQWLVNGALDIVLMG